MLTAVTPKIIGICGYPGHGKSTAQRFLSILGVEPRDDADELRKLACKEFGLTWEQVSTQEGKAQMCDAFGTRMTVRQALGDLGQVYERNFGPNYWVDLATNLVLEEDPQPAAVSFGSLRRTQPAAVKARGGLIISINDPRKPSSPHHFDDYDFELVDVVVMNEGDETDLAWCVYKAVEEYLQPSPAQVRALVPFF